MIGNPTTSIVHRENLLAALSIAISTYKDRELAAHGANFESIFVAGLKEVKADLEAGKTITFFDELPPR